MFGEDQKTLTIGDSQEYTGEQFLELIDIADALQEKHKQELDDSLEKVFSKTDVEESLVSLGYSPAIIEEIVENSAGKLQEKEKLSDVSAVDKLINVYEKCKEGSYSPSEEPGFFLTGVVSVVGGVVGFAAGFYAGVQLWGWGYHPDAHPALITFVPAAATAALLAIPTYFYERRANKKSNAESQLQQKQQEQELQSAKELWKPYYQNLSPSDFIIIDDNGKYRTAYVKEVDAEKVRVVMNYTQKNSQSTTWLTRLEEYKLEKVVGIIEPKHSIPLTTQNVQDLPLRSPLACVDANRLSFGHLGKKTEKDFIIFSDRDCEDRSGKFQYQDIEEQKVKSFLLGLRK